MNEKNLITVTDNKNLLDLDMAYRFTTQYSFSKGISECRFNKAIDNSWCFGIFLNEKQIGFARFITDYATFAMMRDVFILPEYRQQGYAQMLIQHMLNEIKKHDIRRVMLGTIDSHGLYKKLGITPLKHPEYFMEYDHFTDYATQAQW